MNCNKFYRNNFACASFYDEDKDTHFMYVGFEKSHSFYGSIFQNVLSFPLYHYNLTFENESHQKLWWMGFSIQTTYNKAMDRFKKIIDNIPKN